MSTIKNHFLPDSKVFQGIFVFLAFVTVRLCFGQNEEYHRSTSDPQAARTISTITEHYSDKDGKLKTAQTRLDASSKPNNPNPVIVKPTDPKHMGRRIDAEASAATGLLQMLQKPKQPVEPTAAPKTEAVEQSKNPNSITFLDGLPKKSDSASAVNQDVDAAKSWLFLNLRPSLQEGDLLGQLFEVISQSKANGKNLQLNLGAGLFGNNAQVVALRNNQLILFDVPQEARERFSCHESSVATGEKGRWNPPGKRCATLANLTCQVQAMKDGVALVELAANCHMDAKPVEESYLVLAEIWSDRHCIQRFSRIELKPNHRTIGANFRFATSLELIPELDPQRPFIVFLSLVQDEQKRGTAVAFSKAAAADSQYSSVSNVLALAYDRGHLIHSH